MFSYDFGWNMDYPKPWNNERLTDLLIQKFIVSRQFELIIEEIDVTELEVTSESDKGSDYSEEMIIVEQEIQELQNLGIEITEEELVILRRLGYTREEYTIKEFVPTYRENAGKPEEEIK